jgi:hypothetical protein
MFTNWKTSLAGLVFAIGQYLVIQGETGFTWESFLIVLPTLILGLIAKDK